jgi:hypothetical protein
MTLLDIPSWAASLRKLVKIYQLAGGRPGLERVRYSFEITHVHESFLYLFFIIIMLIIHCSVPVFEAAPVSALSLNCICTCFCIYASTCTALVLYLIGAGPVHGPKGLHRCQGPLRVL